MIPDGVKVMDMSFDVRKVFQERLASSMGLDKYRYIMEQVSITNVAIDTDFQRTFNGFYVVSILKVLRMVSQPSKILLHIFMNVPEISSRLFRVKCLQQ